MLDADLIERLNARAADPATRHDAAGAEMMIAGTRVAKMQGPFGAFSMAIGARPQEALTKYAPGPLPAPASREEIAEAEKRMGLTLPEDLKSVYVSVANGGFGPSDGFLSLSDAAGYLAELKAEPQGEFGEEWPDHLFPIIQWDMGCDSHDLKTGEIVRWTPEILVEEPGKSAWEKSFNAVSPSLTDYLEKWLASPPPKTPQSEALSAREIAASMGKEVNMDSFIHLQNCFGSLQRATPEEIAQWNLPDGPLDEALCVMLNLDVELYTALLKALPPKPL